MHAESTPVATNINKSNDESDIFTIRYAIPLANGTDHKGSRLMRNRGNAATCGAWGSISTEEGC